MLPDGVPPEGAWQMNLWPGGVLPYAFDPNVVDVNQERALEAMAELEAVASVHFVPRTDEDDYIVITASSVNSSFVGRIGGPQPVLIAGWTFRFVIVHELMHALGAWHEHQRPDRDGFVQINWQNIAAGFEPSFEIPALANAYGAYDLDSVMHYGQCAFAACGCPDCMTITVLPPNEPWQELIGQRDHLSEGDIALVRHLYGDDPDDVYEENDTLETAVPISMGAYALRLHDDDDYFRLVLAETATVTVSIAFPPNELSVELRLLDSEGVPLQVSPGQEGSAMVSADLDPGAYLVQVTRIDGIGAYQLDLSGPITDCTTTRRLIPDDVTASGGHGSSVSMSLDTIAIGAPRDDALGTGTGAVRVYHLDEGGAGHWGLFAVLRPLEPTDGALFGAAVAVAGDLLAIGAPGDDTLGPDAGAVHLYRRSLEGPGLWELVKTITAPDGAEGDAFGSSVAVKSNVLFAGAPGDDDGASVDVGAVRLFERNAGGSDNWGESAVFRPDAPAGGERLGAALAMEGQYLVAGAPGDPAAGSSGFAVVYRSTNDWNPVSTIESATPQPGDEFGASVAIAGDLVVVGAPGFDGDAGSDVGSASAFGRNVGGQYNFGLLAAPAPSAPQPGARFGAAVATTGLLVHVGVPGPAGSPGVVEVLGRDEGGADAFGRLTTLTAPDGATEGELGSAVAASQTSVLVGAPAADPLERTNAGAAILITLGDCNANGIVDPCDLAIGASVDFDGSGVPDECEDICVGDIDGDDDVGTNDLLALLASWGPCPDGCAADLDGSENVDVGDLLLLLSAWGPCGG
jgi:hypothetical protein